MAVLVLAEHDNKSIRKATLNAVAAAKKIGGDIHILLAGHQDMDGAADFLCRRDRVQGRLADRLVVVLGKNQDGHQITFASLRSLSTSALASATFTPALRLAGSTTLSVVSLGETSTPSASGFSVSSVFFFAFMMFGSVT